MNFRASLVASSFLLSACTIAPFDIEQESARLGLQRSVVQTSLTRHELFSTGIGGSPVFVFIEGDGRPWADGGTRPSADPTPVNALAFELMNLSSGSRVYITRPCYFGIETQRCSDSLWTGGRFSEDVVASMTEALLLAGVAGEPIVLVGYSGGGALALLMAPRLPGVIAVVTVAGLVDTDAWTESHGYDALDTSLNPAKIVWDGSIMQIHLLAENDNNIKTWQTQAAIARWKNAEAWVFEDYDHACCWADDWPVTWARIVRAIESFSQSARND